MCFPVTPFLGASLKLNVATKEQWQPNKISKSPLMLLVRHLLPILICCPRLTNAWRKSVIQSRFVLGITRYRLCRVRSCEVKLPPYTKQALASYRRTVAPGWFSHQMKYVISKQNQRNTEIMMMILKMPKQFPLWHSSSGSIAQSKHGSNSDKFTM